MNNLNGKLHMEKYILVVNFKWKMEKLYMMEK